MVVGATTDADHAFIPAGVAPYLVVAAVTTLLSGVQPFFSDQHGVGSAIGDGRQVDWGDITADDDAIQNAGAVVGGTVEGCAVGEAGTGIAVAQVAPPERQAGASGLLGGIQTLTGGIVAMTAGIVYEHYGRQTAFVATGITMFTLVCLGCVLVGPKYLRRPASASEVAIAP